MNYTIMKLLKLIINQEFFRFAIVGIIATAIHYGIYYVLLCYINVSIAYSIGYMLSFIVNFWLSAKFTFRTKTSVKRGLGFAISHLINYFLQIIVLNIMLFLDIPKEIAPIPVYAICIPVNFLLVRLVFKKI